MVKIKLSKKELADLDQLQTKERHELVYLDNASTTMMCADATQAMMDGFSSYGNPSSLHSVGRKANDIIKQAEKVILNHFNCCENDYKVIFTSGGTESDNIAIMSAVMYGIKNNKMHIVSSKIEHPAVLNTLNHIAEEYGFTITLLDVDENGVVKLGNDGLLGVLDRYKEDICLVSIMYINNEIGTIQPMNAIKDICDEYGILFHTDAVQAVGHVNIDLFDKRINYLSASSHKFHGPKGIGFLLVKNDNSTPVHPIMFGGGQQDGIRSGTEDVISIMAMAKALEWSKDNMLIYKTYCHYLRYYIIKKLSDIDLVKINGINTGSNIKDQISASPGIVSVSFFGVEAESLLLMLDTDNVCVSAGSACSAGSLNPSHVLEAIGVPEEYIYGTIRISMSSYTTLKQIDYAIDMIKKNVNTLRSMSEAWRNINGI